MRKIKFKNGGFYHIYNRGLDKRNIYIDEQDREMFLHALQKFNKNDQGERFVDIVCYALMGNHFHLMLKQRIDCGISHFMHKIGISYTKKFNTRLGRKGHIFEDSYKVQVIKNDSHFLHISRYIHLNPLNFFQSDWKDSGIGNVQKAFDYLRRYHWSSYTDVFSKKRSFCDFSVIKDQFRNAREYDRFLLEWMRHGSPLSGANLFDGTV